MTEQILTIKLLLSMAGGMLAHLMGGNDSLIHLIVAAVILDFILGILAAVKNKEFSSSVAKWGFVSKLICFVFIAVCTKIDTVIGKDCFIRNVAIIWFLLCEGASLLENSAKLGVPLPQGLIDVLIQAKNGFSIRIIDVVKKIVTEYAGKESEE